MDWYIAPTDAEQKQSIVVTMAQILGAQRSTEYTTEKGNPKHYSVENTTTSKRATWGTPKYYAHDRILCARTLQQWSKALTRMRSWTRLPAITF
jgi:hypothetical protein